MTKLKITKLMCTMQFVDTYENFCVELSRNANLTEDGKRTEPGSVFVTWLLIPTALLYQIVNSSSTLFSYSATTVLLYTKHDQLRLSVFLQHRVFLLWLFPSNHSFFLFSVSILSPASRIQCRVQLLSSLNVWQRGIGSFSYQVWGKLFRIVIFIVISIFGAKVLIHQVFPWVHLHARCSRHSLEQVRSRRLY